MKTKIKFYQYPKCSTCVKASQFLRKKGVEVTAIDITLDPPSAGEIRQMVQAYGGNFRKLFNTSGQVYRELRIGARVDTMTAEDAVKLLASNGRLIKRPFLWAGDRGIVGFKEAEWSEFLEQ